MRNLNIVGPQVRRLRSQRGWSQNDFATKLQILGMGDATRSKVSKIESRMVWIADEDLMFLSRALGVAIDELYPDFIRGAKRIYDAISMSKASRFGAFLIGAITCTQLGAGAARFGSMVAGV
jgi:transcriptional regulator with XRE-family HTH domain